MRRGGRIAREPGAFSVGCRPFTTRRRRPPPPVRLPAMRRGCIRAIPCSSPSPPRNGADGPAQSVAELGPVSGCVGGGVGTADPGVRRPVALVGLKGGIARLWAQQRRQVGQHRCPALRQRRRPVACGRLAGQEGGGHTWTARPWVGGIGHEFDSIQLADGIAGEPFGPPPERVVHHQRLAERAHWRALGELVAGGRKGRVEVDAA